MAISRYTMPKSNEGTIYIFLPLFHHDLGTPCPPAVGIPRVELTGRPFQGRTTFPERLQAWYRKEKLNSLPSTCEGGSLIDRLKNAL